MNDRPLFIRADQVVLPPRAHRTLSQGAVRVIDGKIEAADAARILPNYPTFETLECALLMPGFIDLHVHGCGGHSFAAGPEAVREAARLMAASGVTTFYAGLGQGASLAAIAETVAGAAAAGEETGGAKLAGIFLEGPFISVEKRGAWNAAHLRAPSIPELNELVAASGGCIRRVNVAPELPGAIEFIHAAVEQGIVVSLGHSNATYEQAKAGIEAGARIATHTYNAMSGLDHRQPGLVGAVMRSGLLAELILDGVHVHPVAAGILQSVKGLYGIALITDGSPLTGMSDGTYEFGGRAVTVRDGAARLADGTLAGGVATFDQVVRNAARWLSPDRDWLAEMSSGKPAFCMDIWEHTSAIEPGMDADLVLLDRDLNVLATVVQGKVVYRAPGMPQVTPS